MPHFWDEDRRDIQRVLSSRKRLLEKAILDVYGPPARGPRGWMFVAAAVVVALVVWVGVK